MTKIAVVSDMHFGVRKNSPLFLDQAKRFSDDMFRLIKANNIRYLINLGDLFDNRKILESSTADAVRNYYIEPIEQMDINHFILCGNHDAYHDNTNEVNWLKQMFNPYKHCVVDTKILKTTIDDHRFTFLPWIAPDHRAEFMKEIKHGAGDYLCGHLELNGYKVTKGVDSTHGDDETDFKHFRRVLTGHFHHKQTRGNITYVGAPYEMTWDDEGTWRGWHILDLDDDAFMGVQNPETRYVRQVFSDVTLGTFNPDHYKNKIVNFIILDKKFEKLYEDKMIPLLRTAGAESVVVDTPEDISDKQSTNPLLPEKETAAGSMSEHFDEYLESIEITVESKRDVYRNKLNNLYSRAKHD